MWGEFCTHYPLKTSQELEMEKMIEQHNKRLSFRRKVKGFIIAGASVFIISLIGLIAFIIKSFQIIHPILYIFGMIFGLGWFLTGMSIIKKI